MRQAFSLTASRWSNQGGLSCAEVHHQIVSDSEDEDYRSVRPGKKLAIQIELQFSLRVKVDLQDLRDCFFACLVCSLETISLPFLVRSQPRAGKLSNPLIRPGLNRESACARVHPPGLSHVYYAQSSTAQPVVVNDPMSFQLPSLIPQILLQT